MNESKSFRLKDDQAMSGGPVATGSRETRGHPLVETPLKPKAKSNKYRANRWYKKWRAWLIDQLAGGQKPACALCGKTWKIEIDHQDGRDWYVEDKSSTQRIRKYIREFKAGIKLRLLCRWCNASDWRKRPRA